MRSLTEQARAVAAGDVSPVELVADSLAAVERAQAAFNAFTVVLGDQALARAKELEGSTPVGELHGVPVAVKDLYDMANVPTSGCCAAYADRVASSDSVVVSKLESAGAIIVAKTNQHELACGATTQVSSYGPVFNPWDIARIPGGSSGGSGAAVGAGVVTMAMGSDTGGSIRIPASLCGVTGLKPTHGAVSLRGAMPMSPTFDTGGPLAVSAADCALVFSVVSGPDPNYLWSAAGEQAEPSGPSGIRVGVLTSFMSKLHPETKAGLEGAAKSLEELGATLVDVDGLDPAESRVQYAPLLFAEVADCYRDLWDDARVSPDIAFYLQMGRGITGPDYARRNADRLELRKEFLRALDSVDVLLAPSTPYPAPRIDDVAVPVESGTLDVHAGGPATLTIPINASGLPSLAFPVGFSSDELPLGAQLIGPPWSELRLCSVVDAYQRTTGWHFRRPGAP